MSSNVHPTAWKNYLHSCAWLGYEPEETVETNILQRYNTLYTRYCQDNGLQFDPSTNLDSDVDKQKLSELLYLDLCQEFGFESIIQIRRNIGNLMELVLNQLDPGSCCFTYHSGSVGEGFKMSASDIDVMTVHTDNLIVNNTAEIPELSCVKVIDSVMTMETQYTKPGYVRLILETDKYMPSERMSRSGHNYDDKLYLSSALYREEMMSLSGQNVDAHGPAVLLTKGIQEYDHTNCLSCTSQPTAVQNWKTRCNKYNWPDSVVLKKCISLGCQLAPVGSKESPHEDLEWRISFVSMEKPILQSLSHSQFMCYGLLKLYLKEVLGSFEEINDLVSSYFMKTVLLWEIQKNREHNVGADSLLQLFENCLQRLNTYVQEENCPSFFILENNMFENRIYGQSKRKLENILELLLKEKYYGLYKCQSIDLPYLIFQVLIYEKKSVAVSVNEGIYVTNKDIEKHTWLEIHEYFHVFQLSLGYITELDTLLQTLKLMLTKGSLTDLEKRAVHTWINSVTIRISTHNFKDIIAPNVSPDIEFEKYKSCCNILRTHDEKGSAAPLHLATLMYITGRYLSCLDVITECFTERKDRFADVMHVSVSFQLTELRLELELSFFIREIGIERTFLQIHQIVYASMLSVLCHYHLGDVDGTEFEFQRLLTQPVTFGDISWQVLGICAEIIGKYDEAYQSYVRAYRSPRNSLNGNAPLLRVLCLIYKRLPK